MRPAAASTRPKAPRPPSDEGEVEIEFDGPPSGANVDRSAEVRRAIEAILFLADEPVTTAVLAQAVEMDRRKVEAALGGLEDEYSNRGAGIVLQHVAGGWRLATHPDASPYVEQFIVSARHTRLTKASLETLAVVAYKQPVTRHQVSSIRGVDSDGVLRSLAQRGLIAEVGRDGGPGRAVLYGTTPEFLERLGLASLADLPPLVPLLDEAVPAEPNDPAPDAGTADRPGA